MENVPAWAWSDAWILGALGPGRRWTRVRSLLRSADMLNHAIPGEGEVSQAMGRLIASGLAEHRGQRFRLTRAGARLYWRGRGRQFEIVDSLFQLLNDVPLTTAPGPMAAGLVLERRQGRTRQWMPWTWRSYGTNDWL